jgi:hypothetical protein
MSYPYNTDTLVEDIKVICSLPVSAALVDDSEIRKYLTEQQEAEVVPLINSLRSEYFVITEDVPLVTNVFEYQIPTRAIGNKLRDICLVDTNGFEIDLPQLDPSQIKVKRGPVGIALPYFRWGYYLKYNKAVLYFGSPGSELTGFPTLRFKYYRKPNHLTNEYSVITGLPAANQAAVTIVSIFDEGDEVDIIDSHPIFVSKQDNAVIDTIAGNTITFVDDLPSTVAIGDVICATNFTYYPQLPVESWNLLKYLAAEKVFGNLGDPNGLVTAANEIQSQKKAFLNEFSPRNEGTSIKINPTNTIFDSGWF